MSLADSLFGTPPSTSYTQTSGTRPPGFNFANSFFNSLEGISQNPFPTYASAGGHLDPGLSPTLTDLIQRAQGYAGSTPPSILQGAAGTFGRMMSPNLSNPITRMFGGAPNYSGVNPNQRVFGGGTAGSMTMPGTMTSMNGGGLQGGGGGWQDPGFSYGNDAQMRPMGRPGMQSMQADQPPGGPQSMNGGGLQGTPRGGMQSMSAPGQFGGGGSMATIGGWNDPGFSGGGGGAMPKPAFRPGGMGGGYQTPGIVPGGGWGDPGFSQQGPPGLNQGLGTIPGIPGSGPSTGAGPGGAGGAGGYGTPGSSAGTIASGSSMSMPPPGGGGGWSDPGFQSGGNPMMSRGMMGARPSGQFPINSGGGAMTPRMPPAPPPMMGQPMASQPGMSAPPQMYGSSTFGGGAGGNAGPTQSGAPSNFIQGIGNKAWNMGNLMNRGQLDPTGTHMWTGAGGGEQGQWSPYNAGDSQQKAIADMFSRFGSNWSSGSGSAYGHSSEMGPQFQALTGRQGTPQELNDLYYGVDPAQSRAAYDAFSNQSAAYNPASSSYSPQMAQGLTSLNLLAHQ